MRQHPLNPAPRAITFLLVLSFAVLAPAVDSQTVDKRIRSGGFGLRAGAIAPSTWTVEGDDYGTTLSVGVGAFLETALREGLSARFAADIHNISSSSLNDQELFFTFLVGPRWLIRRSESNIKLRPGASLGVGYMGKFGNERFDRVVPGSGDADTTANQRDRIDRTTYLAYALELELLFLSPRNQTVVTFVDFGFIGTLSGGNSETDASINPTVTAHIGVMY